MAKYVAQIIVTGAQIVGRAFARAVQAEIKASQQAAQARAGTSSSSSKSSSSAASDVLHGMSLQEAKQILKIEDIKDVESLKKNYEHLFSVNEKSKGGSIYLQSKVVRAKERIEEELSGAKSADAKTSEASNNTTTTTTSSKSDSSSTS